MEMMWASLAFLTALSCLISPVAAASSSALPSTSNSVLGCPQSCSCTKVRSGLLKLRCSDKIDDVFSLDFGPMASQVVQLDLSKNLIEDLGIRPFSNLTNLKRLDLSSNRISSLKRHSFEGLRSLDVLKLSQNTFKNLDKGIFDDLTALKKLDISNNSLECDCAQLWLLGWARNVSVKLVPMPKCSSPPHLSGKSLSQLREDGLLPCRDQVHTFDVLELHPQQDQVVFEGDRLRLQCHAPNAVPEPQDAPHPRTPTVSWFWGSKDPSTVFEEVHIENRFLEDSGLLQSSLTIAHLLRGHSGQWNCLLVSGHANHSRTVSIIVISDDTQYCPQAVTTSNKGVYTWPRTVVGFTAELPCEIGGYGAGGELRARQDCDASGKWQGPNLAVCPYASETTRVLQDFSRMNLTEDHGLAILESAQRLHNLSAGPPPMTDKMDAIFLSQAINNYLKFVPGEKELGALLIDMVSNTMLLPRSVLRAAQYEEQACSRLVHAVEVLAEHVPSMQSHKSNLAVEEFRMKHESFQGITCFWYSAATVEENITPTSSSATTRLFQCSYSNNTALTSNKEKVIDASIQVPASLFYQLEMQGMRVLPTLQLLVAMYENSNLFPRIPNNDTSDRWDVVSYVIGIKLVGMRVHNLTDPLYVVMRAPEVRETGIWPRPVWWDEEMNGGLGGWNQRGCTLSHHMNGMLVFQCDRFGYFGLLQELPYHHEGRTHHNILQLSHPAIYVGSIILVSSLLLAIVTYIGGGPNIQMPKRTKHALINTWIAISLLSFIYSVGIHQTEDAELCQSVGLILHYLTLSTLLWMAITVSNMRRRLKKHNPLDLGSEDDLPPSSPPPPKPLLGLYLVGWGVGLMVVGVSGAVNLKQYRYLVPDEYCFLAPSPALGAVLVPCGAVVVYLLVCVLLVRCDIAQRHADTNAQLSDGTQGTENVDLELLDCAVPAPPDVGSVSVVSAASSEVEDAEHTPVTQLKATLIILLLFASMWAAGALSTATQLHDLFPHAETVFCSLYALAASLLAAFVLFFHCFARSDVRSCWQGLHCRTRNVSDTHTLHHPTVPTVPTMPSASPKTAADLSADLSAERCVVTPVPVSLSNRVSSSTSINSSKSHNLKAAVELNKSVEGGDAPSLMTGPNKVHLMPMYRSYHSVTDPEIFYNARQSDMARKFFRKQRRQAAFQHNQLGARRRGDGGGDQSDLEHTLRDSLRGSRSKVCNTNIHVEQQIDGMLPNLVHKRNILTEEASTPNTMERWVIGADSPPQINNDGTRRGNTPEAVSTPVHSRNRDRTVPVRGGTLESTSSRRSRNSGARNLEKVETGRRDKFRNNSVHNGTISSVSSVRSRDWGVQCREEAIDRVTGFEATPAIGCEEVPPIVPCDTSSAVSEASLPASRVSETESDMRSVNRATRLSSRSPRSKRRHKRINPPLVASHPTSLASSALSLQSKEHSMCNGNMPRGQDEDADIGSEDDENETSLSKKETCV